MVPLMFQKDKIFLYFPEREYEEESEIEKCSFHILRNRDNYRVGSSSFENQDMTIVEIYGLLSSSEPF